MSSFSTNLAMITSAVSSEERTALYLAFQGLSKFAAMLSPVLSGSASTTFPTYVLISLTSRFKCIPQLTNCGICSPASILFYETDEEDEEEEVIGSPYSVFSAVSDASTNTSVASNDLWEKTDITNREELLVEVKPEHIVSATNDDHCGPTDSSHLVARPWAPEFTVDEDKGKIIYTALYTQVSYHDLAAELEAWDDGLFVEAEDELPDWRASCTPLQFTAPVPSVDRTAIHYGPADKEFLNICSSVQDSADWSMVESPLSAQVNHVDPYAAMDPWDDGLFVDSGNELPDWRLSQSPITFTSPLTYSGSIEAQCAYIKLATPSTLQQTLGQDVGAEPATIVTHQHTKGNSAFSKIMRRLGKQKANSTSNAAAPVKKSAFKKLGRLFTGRRERKEATIDFEIIHC